MDCRIPGCRVCRNPLFVVPFARATQISTKPTPFNLYEITVNDFVTILVWANSPSEALKCAQMDEPDYFPVKDSSLDYDITITRVRTENIKIPTILIVKEDIEGTF